MEKEIISVMKRYELKYVLNKEQVAYFQEEIKRIQDNNAYVTEDELKNYLELVIEKNMTTCNLIDLGDDVYELKLPISDKKILSRFLTTNQPSGEENEVASRQKLNPDEKQRHVEEHDSADSPRLSAEVMRTEPQRDEAANGV